MAKIIIVKTEEVHTMLQGLEQCCFDYDLKFLEQGAPEYIHTIQCGSCKTTVKRQSFDRFDTRDVFDKWDYTINARKKKAQAILECFCVPAIEQGENTEELPCMELTGTR